MKLPLTRARLAACIGATCLAVLAAGQPVALATAAPAHHRADGRAVPHPERSVPSGNLLQNPGAEAGVGGDLPSWDTTPGFVAEQYGAQFRPGVEISQQIAGGTQFFAGGSEATVSSATQVVDVSSDQTEIDARAVVVVLNGYLGGIDAEGDYAGVSATFLGATGTQALGPPATMVPVTAADRGNQTKMLLRSVAAVVPPGTRRILVTITSTRVDGTYTDGYADNLSLALAWLPGATVVGSVKVKGRKIKGKISASAPCLAGRKVGVTKGRKTLGSSKTNGSGTFSIKTKKHKKGKLTIKVKGRTIGTTKCAALKTKVPGQN